MEKETWEDRFDRIPHGAPLSSNGDYISVRNAKDFIRVERKIMISEIIGLMTTHTEHNGNYCDTGEDMEWACRSECVEMAEERLKGLN
jgi:hypothetical protein